MGGMGQFPGMLIVVVVVSNANRANRPCPAYHHEHHCSSRQLQLAIANCFAQYIMAPESAPPKSGGMMSLYANLLDPSAESTPGTISRAPVVFKQSSETDAQPDESAAKKQQLNAGTFEFL